MQVIKDVDSLRAHLLHVRCEKKSVGLVPTMGALHEGHLSLIKKAIDNNDICVASIFVNPAQFNNKSDLSRYPRNLDADLKILESAGCDIVFCPDVDIMYANEPMVTLGFGGIENAMEGYFRPGHFSGVGLVVSKLLNIVEPSSAYFGQKDLQQFLIVQKLVEDMHFDVDLVCMPIIREKDGLAKSSRNVRLNADERAAAPILFQAINSILPGFIPGITKLDIVTEIKTKLLKYPIIDLEYCEVVNSSTLEIVETIDGGMSYAICIAANVGKVRLIDNIILSL